MEVSIPYLNYSSTYGYILCKISHFHSFSANLGSTPIKGIPVALLFVLLLASAALVKQ